MSFAEHAKIGAGVETGNAAARSGGLDATFTLSCYLTSSVSLLAVGGILSTSKKPPALDLLQHLSAHIWTTPHHTCLLPITPSLPPLTHPTLERITTNTVGG